MSAKESIKIPQSQVVSVTSWSMLPPLWLSKALLHSSASMTFMQVLLRSRNRWDSRAESLQNITSLKPKACPRNLMVGRRSFPFGFRLIFSGVLVSFGGCNKNKLSKTLDPLDLATNYSVCILEFHIDLFDKLQYFS